MGLKHLIICVLETAARDVITAEHFNGDLMSVKREDVSLTTSVLVLVLIGVIVGLICGDGCSSLDSGGVLGCDLFYLGSLSDDLCVVPYSSCFITINLIEIRWAVEVAKCFEAISSLAMVSANLAKDSSMVGGVDVGGIGESNESTIVIYRFEMVSLPRTRLRSGRIRPLERARLQEL
ncbi:hypothetical protein Tco_0746489 [Tanacetum coccineum]